MKKYYITTAIDYINATPHIGNAYEKIFADVLARYHRLQGEDVFFSYGTDEHGMKAYQTAQKSGKDLRKFADKMSANFKGMVKPLNLSINDFIRTTDKKRHWPVVQKIWQLIKKNGDIYKKNYSGYYCVGCEAFVIKNDLVDGRCIYHPGRTLQKVEEENYFFKFSKYNKFLFGLFKKNPKFVTPESRYNENLEFLKRGLEDISFSRSAEKLPWGIPVPGDPSQVIYVWPDALINYLSLIDFGRDSKKFKKWWPADLHIVGKDIARWHVLLWPAMLKSAGLSLPKQVLVHGFINVNGQKMSKSLGNVIDPVELVEKYGTDPCRYFLLREISYKNDGDFTYGKFEKRYNADLANGIGNLVQRVIVMVDKYFDGKIPKIDKDPEKHPLRIGNKYYTWKDTYKDYSDAFTKLDLHKALFAINKFVNTADKYIEETKPWKLAQNKKQNKLSWVLFGLLDSIHQLAWQIYPFMPTTSIKIAKALKIEGLLKQNPCIKDSWVNVKPGAKIGLENPLFPKIE